jgi:tRNA threonylcarbamoyl adenosine modification protein YeaZ
VLVLAVDTSAVVVSAAVGDVHDDHVTVIASRDVAAANRHGELLAATVAEVLSEAAVAPAALAAIAAGLGPGPFTGLRVGVVTAATMSDALGVPAYGVCSLDALARQVSVGSSFLVCTDARRKQIYWARYDASGTRVEGPDIATAAVVAGRFAGEVPVVAGVGASLYDDDFASFAPVRGVEFASARDIVRLVKQRVRAGSPPDVMEPLYLRRPDATPPGRPKSVLPA